MTTTSTHKGRLAMLALIGGIAASLVPLAQAGYDPGRIADSVDAAQQTMFTETGYGRDRVSDSVDAARAGGEQATLGQTGYGRDRISDSVDNARADQARAQSRALSARHGLSRMPDLVERTAAAGAGQYRSSSRA